MGQGHETIHFGDQEVKDQGHTRPKIDLEAWRRHQSFFIRLSRVAFLVLVRYFMRPISIFFSCPQFLCDK